MTYVTNESVRKMHKKSVKKYKQIKHRGIYFLAHFPLSQFKGVSEGGREGVGERGSEGVLVRGGRE